jgi:transposase
VGNKNYHNDAIAIAEASMRPKETFVAIKNWLSKACRISNTYVKG